MKATEKLTEEHKCIKEMLEVIKEVCRRLDAGNQVDAGHLEEILEFIKEFADQYHHAKEEDLLFPVMEKAGIPREGGPVGVMLMEHDQGRAYVKGMREAVAKYKAGDPSASSAIVQNARGYVSLLTDHIDKEDQCLYPMADAQFSDEQQQELVKNFAKVEEERGGAQMQEKFHKLLSQLRDIYLGQRKEA